MLELAQIRSKVKEGALQCNVALFLRQVVPGSPRRCSEAEAPARRTAPSAEHFEEVPSCRCRRAPGKWLPESARC